MAWLSAASRPIPALARRMMPSFTGEQLAQSWGLVSNWPDSGASMPDRVVRFPADVRNQGNDLPDPSRTTVQRTIFGLFDGPVPAAARRLAADPAWYELHVSADDVTIWYTIPGRQGHEVVSVLLTGGQGVEDDVSEDESSGLLDASGCSRSCWIHADPRPPDT